MTGEEITRGQEGAVCAMAGSLSSTATAFRAASPSRTNATRPAPSPQPNTASKSCAGEGQDRHNAMAFVGSKAIATRRRAESPARFRRGRPQANRRMCQCARVVQRSPGVEFMGRVLALRLLDLCRHDTRRNRAGYAAGNLILDRKEEAWADLTVVAVSQAHMVAACSLDQLSGDARTVARSPHTAAQGHHGEAQLAADFGHVHGGSFVGKGGAARDHEKQMVVRQVGDDVLGDAFGEILLLASPLMLANGSTAMNGFCGNFRRPGTASRIGEGNGGHIAVHRR